MQTKCVICKYNFMPRNFQEQDMQSFIVYACQTTEDRQPSMAHNRLIINHIKLKPAREHQNQLLSIELQNSFPDAVLRVWSVINW